MNWIVAKATSAEQKANFDGSRGAAKRYLMQDSDTKILGFPIEISKWESSDALKYGERMANSLSLMKTKRR